MERISIVIPYLQELSESHNTELLFAIRSWCKNAKFDFNIILVGDAPKWYTGDHIQTKAIRGVRYTRAFDIANKLKHIIASELIGENFIYTYDDIYAISPIELNYFDTIVAETEMEDKTYLGSGKWNEMLENTFIALDLPECYNYETHLPRKFNKIKLADIFRSYDLINKPLLFSTLYYNEFHSPDVILNKTNNIKAYLPRKLSRETIHEKASDKLFMNNTNIAWNNTLLQWLKNKFPDKCRYER